MTKKARTVYSTEKGRTCPTCGWPEADCRCAQSLGEPVPERVTAKLCIERSGRKGKTVTVVYGLPRNPDFLQDLVKELKTACGTGGTARDDRVEVQGDQRDTVRDRLRGKGWTVKG